MARAVRLAKGRAMPGSSTGRLFVLTTFGESHGPALGAVLDGCPPGVQVGEELLQRQLDRRRPGRNPAVTQRSEADRVEILSGVMDGRTTGTPIGLLVRNSDARPQDYDHLREVFRPGHADWGYQRKYGVRDHRGGGRASARETAMRVAGGAIAMQLLRAELGVEIRACVEQVGDVRAGPLDWGQVDDNDFFFGDPAKLSQVGELLERMRAQGDSVGAALRLECLGVPAGLGAPVFDKLDADLAGAMMSINAAKAVEVGEGFAAVESQGSRGRDAASDEHSGGFASNSAGGILGGISTGQDIVLRVGFKPTSSVRAPIEARHADGAIRELSVRGRHDPCVGLRAVPIVEAMAALVLADHLLRQDAQNPGWRPVEQRT